jgi:hypothetical protein
MIHGDHGILQLPSLFLHATCCLSSEVDMFGIPVLAGIPQNALLLRKWRLTIKFVGAVFQSIFRQTQVLKFSVQAFPGDQSQNEEHKNVTSSGQTSQKGSPSCLTADTLLT